MMTLSDGKLDKADCDKHDYGHVGDCLRYDFTGFEYDTFVGLGYGEIAE
jgi:phage terminase large subunit